MKRIKRSTWLPAVLLAYFLCMAAVFGAEHIRSGNTMRFALISVAEIAVVSALYIFLRKRERLEDERQRRERHPDKRDGKVEDSKNPS